ncbi:hydroxymethylglutaryl-CoA reductase [Lactobacillus pasteurii DSM 23907 = CRBIP 24.76]|uniref:3-hydroxy-3-methylglutaryl coenzyme A reductase n=1 Tax=Lactobacillus pasteurii DSM 23907 = CRBIP 24.76 TaxID=1423790 RepID=I7LEQ3_9LACO|nr:hydroxymethylglutaryl-CoA reductase, degradative [Lactobacillus pasteurii]KRK08852.1 hydroxymethylglutaryl-CoA reductase [Lactobacillus pasteurii DSM 23907 = CRBIP 24.76]TDG76313.1 hypothetical protein C5L33_001072 [Lactobacillus pasteurii]CCI85963.1 Possible hydroxymethylglutaryl-CoA reductase [Lactobacillus pasteurii DSM 23907 = CRBIP 24.76]
MKFYKLSPQKRREILADRGIELGSIDPKVLKNLNQLSENVVGQLRLPLGMIESLVVNGKSYQVPMATEEPSVVAAANHGANLFAKNGGITTSSQRDGIYGQIVLKVTGSFDLEKFKASFPKLIDEVNYEFASLVKHGGGLKQISARQDQDLVYLRTLVDPAEAMGANKTNAILEYLASRFELEIGVEEKLFAILSNYPSQFATAKASLDLETVGGRKVAEKIVLLSKIGQIDPYRAVTNNKGIMNGVDAVLLATGNDFRAVEAATGMFAKEKSLIKWRIEADRLIGELTLPLAIGTVGGSISVRSDVQDAYKILGPVDAKELAEIIAGVGLANNLAALLAISTKGIQAGHMKLQARNLVAKLDASSDEKEQILQKMIQTKEYTASAAKKFLQQLREE